MYLIRDVIVMLLCCYGDPVSLPVCSDLIYQELSGLKIGVSLDSRQWII